ncbi:MAG TPA: hypothetical protein RMH85_16455 [Polyangiaceae bacterium LLY-WYZ-15_(1-7)]|nr:hypothetical protein [Sandaracinus sp.]HJK94645.1 hypothetical protein [Polyangiaceae bacterium LLY-WYZ-15_(1-7)]MBJ73434.1 hypothetical protein [Sandaracinus sp.]HJL01242.1 hypothetical protein [Polyangiaceae bacterium LLY-WYZ-15_(1-7)]HJL10093.1 hypothetical protein [Polyangiaceae bacterium LLY-WYZ-15_(1-7)]
MSGKGNEAGALDALFEGDEVQEVLAERFYGGEPAKAEPRGRKRKRRKAKAKPDHYSVICISLYKEDLERLDAKVAELKESGHRKMSRSALIRFALDHMDTDKLPKAY